MRLPDSQQSGGSWKQMHRPQPESLASPHGVEGGGMATGKLPVMGEVQASRCLAVASPLRRPAPVLHACGGIATLRRRLPGPSLGPAWASRWIGSLEHRNWRLGARVAEPPAGRRRAAPAGASVRRPCMGCWGSSQLPPVAGHVSTVPASVLTIQCSSQRGGASAWAATASRAGVSNRLASPCAHSEERDDAGTWGAPDPVMFLWLNVPPA